MYIPFQAKILARVPDLIWITGDDIVRLRYRVSLTFLMTDFLKCRFFFYREP